ncbi:hypothetical protein J6590_108331 [Homalodisca vitripennis]|nr:hypothetical protein J6590_108331 [Homalodisca vitripennis]
MSQMLFHRDLFWVCFCLLYTLTICLSMFHARPLFMLMTFYSLYDEVKTHSDKVMEVAYSWFNCNNLQVNTDKTESICFTLKKLNVKENCSKPVKLLGVVFDQKLSWEAHTNTVVSKLSRACFLLLKLKSCVGGDMMLISYFSEFHSHLLYAAMLWGNSKGASQVFTWQRKAVRILANLAYQDDCKQCFIDFNIMTVPSIFIFQNLIHVKKNQNEFVCFNEVHDYYTRRAQDIIIPLLYTEDYS